MTTRKKVKSKKLPKIDSKYKELLQDVCNTYADCNDYATESRNLNALHQQVPVNIAKEIMMHAVLGYNSWDSDRSLDTLIEYDSKALVAIARESSVCIYIHSNKLNKLPNFDRSVMAKGLFPDASEIDVSASSIRIWYD